MHKGKSRNRLQRRWCASQGLNLLWCLCGCPGWGYSRNQISPPPPDPKFDASAIFLPRWSCLDMFRICLPCAHMLIWALSNSLYSGWWVNVCWWLLGVVKQVYNQAVLQMCVEAIIFTLAAIKNISWLGGIAFVWTHKCVTTTPGLWLSSPTSPGLSSARND